ncbi:MAG TPA: hypothetical protein VN653_15785 [Anaerolineales bacterium]|nr:hypothetical protein [Anaerolineales bacterium]
MTEYLKQLQADQTVLQRMLEERRAGLIQFSPVAGDPLQLKVMRPSVKLLHQAFIYILEDALGILNSLIEYFTPQKA